MSNRTDQQTHMEWLDRDECLRLLAGDCIGRLAFTAGRAPSILPVNYALDGEMVVFRTDPGAKVDHGLGAPVAFEIDHFDRDTRTGWSVLVAGRLEQPPPFNAHEHEHLHALPVEPWAGGDKAIWLRIVPHKITGRRINATTP